MTSLNLQWALYYASRGWAVFPVYPMRSSPGGVKCACGKSDCSKGKHPMTMNGRNGASLDTKKITEWWSGEWADANIGIATGRESSLFVVDLDDKHDGRRQREGSKNIRALADGKDFGSPLIAKSGSGGVHLFYSSLRAGSDLCLGNTESKLAQDVDTRGEGGYVVAAPSNHEMGGLYAWVGDVKGELSPPPDWLVELMHAAKAPGSQSKARHTRPEGIGYHLVTRTDLNAYAEYADSRHKDTAATARAFLAGTEIAGNGGRHGAMRDFAASLWHWTRRVHNAWVDPKASYPVFEASCREMEKTAGGVIPDIDWVSNFFYGFEERGEAEYAESVEEGKVLEKSTADFMAHVNAVAPARTVEEQKAIADSALKRAFGTDRDTPYTAEEIAAMEPIEKRWVLCTQAGTFIRVPGGDYMGPISDKGLVPLACRDYLSPAETAGVFMYVRNEKTQELKPKGFAEIADQYGYFPSAMRYSYSVPKSILEGSTFTQKAGRVRPFEPQYDPQIDQWLRLFAGEQIEPLLDWLATLLDLHRPTAAPCIMGQSGAGKDLFADGITQLWGTRIEFHNALGVFNGELTRSPIVFANEEVRGPHGFKGSVAEALKDMISSDRRKVQDKYAHPTDLLGCARVIMATNARGVLKFERQPTEADIEALDDRVLLLRPGREARQYLIDIGGRDVTETWVGGGKIAQHVMWLRSTRVVKPGPRFLVQGQGGMSTVLAADGRGSVAVLAAIIKALIGPMSVNKKVAHRDEDGKVWVSMNQLKENWATYGGKDQVEDMGAVFNVICEPNTSWPKKVEGELVRMRVVKEAVLLRAASADGDDTLEQVMTVK
jgi:hypothetical protein